jgi:hypothetical protein
MIGRRLVSWFARAALVALVTTAFFAGCSRQSEGERCDKDVAGDTDCNEGLVCVQCIDLREGLIDRCCPPNPGQGPASCARADPQRAANECEVVTSGGRSGFAGAGGLGARAGAGGMSGGMSGSSAMSGSGGAESGGSAGTEAGGTEAGGTAGQ